ncbi:hypothetical protein SUGI_1176740 [Cryptomeria japonica]|nr:hypothetical protein SUGI_1176740 [Cryptomeria japonica]
MRDVAAVVAKELELVCSVEKNDAKVDLTVSLMDFCDNDKLSRSLSNTSDRSEGTWDAGYEDSTFDPENSWHLRDKDRLGSLYFEYFERLSPYARVSLIDKINCFTREYPELMSLRSVDLSPARWMSVA